MSESISAQPPTPTGGPSPTHKSSLTSEPPDSLPKDLRTLGKSPPPPSTWISAANVIQQGSKEDQFLAAATSPNNLFPKEK